MLTIIIVAVLSAAVGAVTTAGLKWGRSALKFVGSRIRRDHQALYGGRNWAVPQSSSAGAQFSVRLLIPCAPSRAIRELEMDPDRVIPFVRESFAGIFPDEPSLSLPHEGVKFAVANQGTPSDGYLWVLANGRVDLAVDIQLDCDPDQRFTIHLVNVLCPIAMMATAV